jgi:TIR domain-containing protein
LNTRNNVFISYASADADIARRIFECLSSRYQNIWFDENEILWGDNVVQEINTGLQNSLMGIVILSDNFSIELCLNSS